jgi:hypothetical protein
MFIFCVSNCPLSNFRYPQIPVSTTTAPVFSLLLLDRCLPLPKAWVEGLASAARRQKYGVPYDLVFQTKPALAWDMRGP